MSMAHQFDLEEFRRIVDRAKERGQIKGGVLAGRANASNPDKQNRDLADSESGKAKDKHPLQTKLLARYSELLRARNEAQLALEKADGDLMAFRLVIDRPNVLHSWPGRERTWLREFLIELEPVRMPGHD